jgi:molecular chaperone DnaK
VEIHVLQGERTEARYNRTLGRFHLEGHHAGAARHAQDRGHVRHRRERHPERPREGHGHGQGPEDHHHGELGPQGERDRQDGEGSAEHEAEDKASPRRDRARNKLDNLCYTIEKTISENKEKLPEGDVSTLEGMIKEARGAIEKQDAAAVDANLQKLEKEMHRIASAVYGANGGPGGPGAPGAGPMPGEGGAEPPKGKGKDGVIDAEFEESN